MSVTNPPRFPLPHTEPRLLDPTATTRPSIGLRAGAEAKGNRPRPDTSATCPKEARDKNLPRGYDGIGREAFYWDANAAPSARPSSSHWKSSTSSKEPKATVSEGLSKRK